MSQSYEIRFAGEASADIRGLRKFDQRKVLDAVELHLSYEPRLTSKSRIKAMLQPFWSQYRLRIDEFRAYYDVDDESHLVHVLRVLTKTTTQTSEEAP